MKFKFKRQAFQDEAVRAVVDCFTGQTYDVSRFMLEQAVRAEDKQTVLALEEEDFRADIGFKNKEIKLVESEVLANIQAVQRRNGLTVSDKLEGKYNLTVEMETGTGKTYTYIKTMFELNKQYGWSKFIVVVPSVAIREGVYKAFQITEEHFMEEYGRKARYFIYNSKQLHELNSFAADAGINVMIINSQAFNARGKDARRIYMELDEFQSRMPIEVIARTNPIVIIDEPQSVEGAKTKEALKLFNPLFTLRYSATHRPGQEFNKVYRLDALDAYNRKLVKKISVKGITVKGTTSTEGYLYLEGIEINEKQAPVAKLEYEVKTPSGIKRVTCKRRVNDDLYQLSGNLEQYHGYKIAEINAYKNIVEFTNGVVIAAGELQGDVTEQNYRRIQIRETILSHLEKERTLFSQGIKVLSLFFIDKVAKYRQYDKDGNALNGEYATMFEEEYLAACNKYITLFQDDPYVKYLQGIAVRDTHKGYFSIDKKSKQFIDPKDGGVKESDDVDAYNLIMRDKETLLSFAEPTRFIFSHSALREGWDNPNVFQICTLKHSDSAIKKRQEVGRGLRLCVDQHGNRMDEQALGDAVHEINILTVVASESYEDFVRALQSEIADALSERPKQADVAFFLNKALVSVQGERRLIDESLAKKLNKALYKAGYIDEVDNLTPAYFEAVASGNFSLPGELTDYTISVVKLLETMYSPHKPMADNERKRNIPALVPNHNFYRQEFQELWKEINKKTAYTVQFSSDELIAKCIKALDAELTLPDIQYTVTAGTLEAFQSKEQLAQGEAFQTEKSATKSLVAVASSRVRYDLIGKLMEETKLTRRTIAAILSGISPITFALFRKNPEAFIQRAGKIINEQKAATVIQGISYDIIDGSFDTSIFTINSLQAVLGENAHPLKKHIYDYLLTDSKGERNFANKLDISEEVCVFAKLPRGFYIPTPIGKYNPDWAIVFKDSDVKYVYFIAETKGSLASLELRDIEKAKIHCARQHFARISSSKLKYDVVDSYEKLLEIVKGNHVGQHLAAN
ncbi:type III restriction-modification system endonuclease [Sporolituus thermophilus]|uniref:Type III restriction enzyme n=1 Tax=Sporolituus thermophilus DSM 23256 TaxID=1123285 RepID=A0A1G7JS51_9FIRM|nr:DEAD/DEAH box helicase family protein [Sporolituus thermophilus]SDF27772.1 type III restriction enzyme [Sporolituus thermophilus DSM 23256]